jgi:hypothetical protein
MLRRDSGRKTLSGSALNDPIEIRRPSRMLQTRQQEALRGHDHDDGGRHGEASKATAIRGSMNDTLPAATVLHEAL